MPTAKQQIGTWGEELIATRRGCPRCKRSKTYRRLPTNFKCADLICDFCGFLAQVKTSTVESVDQLPRSILGAAWKPQQERMQSAIYFPLYLVLRNSDAFSIYYLPTDIQTEALFEPRAPLSPNARRAGWQGFNYRLDKLPDGALIRIDQGQLRAKSK